MSTPETLAASAVENRSLTIVQALREALAEEMELDPDVFVLGEDIRIGGSFLFTLGMLEKFGETRILNTPISEAGFVGLAAGAATQGLRPIVDFQYGDFVITAADQLIQQASKLRYMSGGQVKVPMVLQLPTGASGRGAQHANPIESWFFGVPGLKIVTPSSPHDAKGLFKTAVRDDNVVLFCVHKHLYGSKGRDLAYSNTSKGYVSADDYTIPFGSADVKRSGSDVTVVANSIMVHRALEAGEQLSAEGIEIEVVDPRTLVPFDLDTVFASVEKTGRLVVVEESPARGGWGGYVISAVADKLIGHLDAPVKRIALPDIPIPFAPNLEASVIPSTERIVKTVREVVGL